MDYCAYPAATPPDGVVPNFVNPTSLAPATFSVCIILMTISVLSVATRLYINWGKFDLADYFLAVGAILTITYSGLILSLHKYNRHQWNVPACWMGTTYLKIIYSHVTIVGLVLMFPKWAILYMYRQLFSIHPRVQIAVWIGAIFCFAIYVPSIPLAAIYEAPKAGESWDYFLNHYPADAEEAMEIWGIVQGTCSVVLDIFIFVTPIPILSKLQMPTRKKVKLVGLFGTAFFGVAASAIALVFRVQLLSTSIDTDITWHEAQLALCVVTENNVAVTVACMPAFAKFVKIVSTHISSRRSRSKLVGSSETSMGKWDAPAPLNATFGSSGQKHRQYYELSESALLKTQVSVHGDGRMPQHDVENPQEPGIMRTMDLHQEESRLAGRPPSVEHFA